MTHFWSQMVYCMTGPVLIVDVICKVSFDGSVTHAVAACDVRVVNK